MTDRPGDRYRGCGSLGARFLGWLDPKTGAVIPVILAAQGQQGIMRVVPDFEVGQY